MKVSLSITMFALAATTASAQIRRPVRVAEPSLWLSGGVGLFQANSISDGATSSTWDFGQASNVQLRLSAEKAFRGGSSIGLVGT
ncbi:MAG: hypothetical protein M3Q09_03075, partial [Gemmatimonadota bacterium]|nr:hypothetical protein [Gemmatimonadota bacterium]